MLLRLVSFVFFTWITVHLYTLLRRFNYVNFSPRLYPRAPGSCVHLPIPNHGYEDAELVPGTSHVIITSGLIFGHGDPEKFTGRRGRILSLDLSSKHGTLPTELKLPVMFNQVGSFNPHGLSVLVDRGENRVLLFVVNHPPAGDTVEVFEIDKSVIGTPGVELKHVKTHHIDPSIVINDVAALDQNRFYYTVYHAFRNQFLQVIEIFLLLRTGSVMYSDGTATKDQVVISSLERANGVSITASGNIYVADTTRNLLQVYRYDTSDPSSVVHIQEYDAQTAIDNFSFHVTKSAEGEQVVSLWAAAHPLMLLMKNHLESPNDQPAPSQVLKFHLNKTDGSISDAEEVLLDPGKNLFGASVAVRYEQSLMIGTAVHGVMVCQIDKNV